jgi:hypothetical protein
MTFQVFCQSFPPGGWKWTSEDPAGVGMQLDGAFRAFAAVVNALPGNASTPLSVIRSHADATANRWGYTRQLGHPFEPAHLWFLTESTTAQGKTQSSSSAVFGNALASTFTNNTSHGGYGTYNNSTISSTALAYVDSTLSGATSIGAILLIAQDTTPGKEFFCWALKTTGGNDALHRDSCHTLYKSPGTTGWNSIAVFPRTSKQFYGQIVLHGYSGNSFSGLPSAIGASITANGHQLRSGIALGRYEFVLQAQGLFDAPPPLIQLPAPLFIGSTTIRGASTHFGKVTRPDGVMLQLDLRHLPEPLAGMQRAALHQQPAPGCDATGLRFGGLHPPLPPHERRGRPSAPAAGSAALWLRRRRWKRRWWGNRRRSDATRYRAALAAGGLRVCWPAVSPNPNKRTTEQPGGHPEFTDSSTVRPSCWGPLPRETAPPGSAGRFSRQAPHPDRAAPRDARRGSGRCPSCRSVLRGRPQIPGRPKTSVVGGLHRPSGDWFDPRVCRARSGSALAAGSGP